MNLPYIMLAMALQAGLVRAASRPASPEGSTSRGTGSRARRNLVRDAAMNNARIADSDIS
jgi:hypothetical protein